MTSKQAVLKSLEKQKNVGQTDEAVAIKKEWLAALDGLFDKIANWLKDATKRKLLEIRPVEVSLREERIGGYIAPSCDIVAPSGIVLHIVPRARFIIGGNGRVDLECPPNDAILIRNNDNDWEFAILNAPFGWRRTR